MENQNRNPQTATEVSILDSLTPDSLSLFIILAEDAGNWNGMPLLPELTDAQKGNLTDLKRKGLLKIERNDGCEWVVFTLAGITACAEYDIDFEIMYMDWLPVSQIAATSKKVVR